MFGFDRSITFVLMAVIGLGTSLARSAPWCRGAAGLLASFLSSTSGLACC
jgi:hypothetical protein